MMSVWLIVLIVLAGLGLLALSIRVVKQREQGVVLRFGRLVSNRKLGIDLIIPIFDRMLKVNVRVVTTILEPQVVITKDSE